MTDDLNEVEAVDRFNHFNQEGVRLHAQYLSTRDEVIGQNSIAALRVALDALPNRPSYLHAKAIALSNLSGALVDVFDVNGEDVLLEEAAMCARNAVEITPLESEDLPGYMTNLGNCLDARYERFKDRKDLEEAIGIQRRAISLAATNQQDNTRFLVNLGNSLHKSFLLSLSEEGIHELIKCRKAVIDNTREDDPRRAARLLMYAEACYEAAITSHSDTEMIDEAVAYAELACRASHPQDPLIVARFTALGNFLLRRFEYMHERIDVDRAITAHSQVVEMTPKDSNDFGCVLCNLSIAYLERFMEYQLHEDADRAVLLAQESINILPISHSFRAGALHALGSALSCKYRVSHEPQDIESAIGYLRSSVQLSDEGKETASALRSLVKAIQCRYEQTHDTDDLYTVKSLTQTAISLLPEDHPWRIDFQLDLVAPMLLSKLRAPNSSAAIADLLELLDTYRAIALNPAAHARQKYEAAHSAVLIAAANIPSWEPLLPLCNTMMEHMPEFIWLGDKLYRRLEHLVKARSAFLIAVLVATNRGRHDLAVEWLEQMHAVTWAQRVQLRSPLDELRVVDAKRATELEDVADRLYHSRASSAARPSLTLQNGSDIITSLTGDGDRQYRKLAQTYDRLMKEVRELPGFGDFLKPARLQAFQPVAKAGPVILLHQGPRGCNAHVLITKPSGDLHVTLIPDLDFTIDMANKMHNSLIRTLGDRLPRERGFTMSTSDETQKQNRGLVHILAILWRNLVHPVLSAVEEELFHATTEEVPHVTWITTGSLSHLPIHAAGVYENDSPFQLRADDFVVSSYAPSLTIMLDSLRHRNGRGLDGLRRPLLAVAQPQTPHQAELPGTVNELRNIRRHIPTTFCLEGPVATCTTVLQGMQHFPWVHLACRGMQDASDPIQSAFMLEDGPLSLADLLKASFTHAQLAFLSACQSATGDLTLPEEAFHLASGMLAVGYSSVIGTAWSINDEDAPFLAGEFYDYLINIAAGDTRRSAYALNHAVKRLRERIGYRAIDRWAPYIHVGV